MDFPASTLALAALGIAILHAQRGAGPAEERVLSFVHTNTPVGCQEVGNAVRAIADIADARIDTAARTLTLGGPANRIATAEWVFQELDRSSDALPPPNSDAHEFHPAGMGDAVARVDFLTNTPAPAAIQEVVNAARSTADIQRLFPINGIHALAMRGTASEVAEAVWILGELDRPSPAAGQSKGVARGYPPGGSGGSVLRVFFLSHPESPIALQELVNATRSVSDVQRFYPVHQSNAIVMRGSAAQAELCAWLIDRLDTDAPAGGAAEFQMVDTRDPVVRLFFPAAAADPQALQQMVNRIRTESQAMRIYPLGARGAIAFRGSAAQAGIAERIVNGAAAGGAVR